ncbi:MAG: hypothetical protein H7X84_05095 [Verrucomicrobia bacterium]|nr:hypothetical protein [Prolixibacteraceae bacterium]
MNSHDDISLPVLFNSFKHHRGYILELLASASPETVATLLETVSNNYVDIYYGTLSPQAIGQAVTDILKKRKVFKADDFTSWVDSNNGYQLLTLEDRSEWIVRRSNEEDRYIHLHPSRTGAYSIRFKGSTLKTVYLLRAYSIHSTDAISLEAVNRVRKQVGLSPVKNRNRSNGIVHCFEKFFSPDL